MLIRAYDTKDLPEMIRIWNEVVEEGVAFPQVEPLDGEGGKEFFASQTRSAVAEDDDGRVVGLYILHPNNVGRCGHIANASYAVRSNVRGQHLGELIVKHSIDKAGELGFRILQFNAVVATNVHARHLYRRLGFVELGTIPEGFRMPDGSYADIVPQYIAVGNRE